MKVVWVFEVIFILKLHVHYIFFKFGATIELNYSKYEKFEKNPTIVASNFKTISV